MNDADDVKMTSPQRHRTARFHPFGRRKSMPPNSLHRDRQISLEVPMNSLTRGAQRGYFLPLSPLSPAASVDNAATNASCGTSTRPMVFIRFLPSFCFSRSLRLRVMSPP